MRTIALLALAAGAMFFAAPAGAVPLTGGVSQGYSDYLNQNIVEVRHRHRWRGYRVHRHHYGYRRHHHRHHYWRGYRGHRYHYYHPYAGPQCQRYYTWQHGRCEPYRGR